MRLRTGTAADVPAMYALDLLCFEPPFTFDLRSMRHYATARGAIVVLAGTETQLAGFVIVNRQGSTAYISTLDVHPDHRRQGLARKLMREAEYRAQTAGAVLMTLHVYFQNHPAIRFYQSLGYTEAATEPNYYGPGLHAEIYSKTLQAEANRF